MDNNGQQRQNQPSLVQSWTPATTTRAGRRDRSSASPHHQVRSRRTGAKGDLPSRRRRRALQWRRGARGGGFWICSGDWIRSWVLSPTDLTLDKNTHHVWSKMNTGDFVQQDQKVTYL
ncbi:hypothetical protein BRADI_5g01005v3 [Brachypodium distachyon]|uniref:Uncharacterized protein n=1 Tax=Brachypodium distachyon TaxID=15368 RepID=A0A2K2CEQ1_BRADI|nr:hypothetical protein BRADI_5g01005v3 [Brachypodium distachyon]